jgi:radical SAM protein with 4Fe4S-binding SPASM domain
LQLPCAFAGRCSSTHVGIDFDLNVAGCGRRLDSRAFLGNLRDAGLVEILAGSDEQRRIAGRSEALRETACAGCRFFPICRGGCPDDAELGTGSLEDRFNWCESFRTLFAAMEAAPAPIPVPAAPARPGPAPEASRSAAPPPRIELFAAADPAAMPADPEGSPARREPWLLPTEDGRALRFDGALESLVDRRGGRAWLWIHNRHARSLAMWEDLVRRRDVVVGLFEAPDLARALNQLNAVEAAIAIDVPVVVAADGGAEALAAAVTRFLGDPLWKAQIFPFSWMLLAAVSGKPRPLTSRYGHPPGRIDVAVGPVGDDPAAAALRAGLEESGASLAAWLAARRPCLECELLPICGACMARGDGSSCHPTALEIARQLARAGAEIASTIGPRAPG